MMLRFLKQIIIIVVLALAFTIAPPATNAQTATFQEATITEISATETITYPDGTQTVVTTFELQLDSGETVTTELERLAEDSAVLYQKNDRVMVGNELGPDETQIYFITDFVRTPQLGWLAVGFLLVVIAIAGKHGLQAILGLASSFGIIFWFLLPKLEAGWNPLQVSIIAAFLIVSVTYYLSHGFKRTTTIAVASTIVALVTTMILAQIAVGFTKLTGFASEEVAFLQTGATSSIQAQGLLLAGIMLGALGVLDDITISQVAIVRELKRNKPDASEWELFSSAMRIGRDHIASLVNTLILVYAGSSLPLLLLFQRSNLSFRQVLNYELLAEEIVRTLVASTGLVLAVPVATGLAVFWPFDDIETNEQTTESHSRVGHHH